MNYIPRKRNNSFLPLISAAAVVFVIALTAAILIFVPRGNDDEIPDDKRPAISETRGVYVASVYNLNFPSKPDLSSDELKGELNTIINNAEEAGLNTIYFQVRPACDALYRSDIFPVSEYLSTDGTLTLDCLEYLINECHARNMAVYAWINPLRVSVSKQDAAHLAPDSPAIPLSKYVVNYNGILYFDAGSEDVRTLVSDGVRELCSNYTLDGIVFDDYFYPYKAYETGEDGTKSVIAFDDEETYKEYGSSFSNVEDFRRNNINLLIQNSYSAVKDTDARCMFGVACFGIWKNGAGGADGSLTKGLESYNEIFCDSLSWINEGYVDFIAPQIYWSTDSTAANYKVLSKWWDLRITEAAENTDKKGKKDKESKIKFLISHAAYKYSDTFESGEITSQLDLASELENYSGSVFYSYAALRDNTNGFADEIKSYYENKDANETNKNEK